MTIKYAVKRSGHYLVKRNGRCTDWTTNLSRASLFTTYYQAKTRADIEGAEVVEIKIMEVLT